MRPRGTAQSCDSVIRDLFYLLVKANFGDIPMEEGLASLCEASAVVGSELVGIENWRREVLQELWPLRPTVAELVTMDARAFQSAEDDFELEPQAAHAMVLSHYLQEGGQLIPLFQAFRSHPSTS
jgi:hypothetical protein